MGALSPGHLLIVLAIVLLVFGTKRLRGVGRDLGEAIKGFKKGMSEGDAAQAELSDQSQNRETADQSQQTADKTPR